MNLQKLLFNSIDLFHISNKYEKSYFFELFGDDLIKFKIKNNNFNEI